MDARPPSGRDEPRPSFAWAATREAGGTFACSGCLIEMVSVFRRVVLTTDIPKEGLRAGDVGVVVEHYAGRQDVPEGYELEFFSGTGETVAVVSVPATSVREATDHEVLSVRELTRA